MKNCLLWVVSSALFSGSPMAPKVFKWTLGSHMKERSSRHITQFLPFTKLMFYRIVLLASQRMSCRKRKVRNTSLNQVKQVSWWQTISGRRSNALSPTWTWGHTSLLLYNMTEDGCVKLQGCSPGCSWGHAAPEDGTSTGWPSGTF